MIAIRGYIKYRIRLDIVSKLKGINGPRAIPMHAVFRWVQAFKRWEIICLR